MNVFFNATALLAPKTGIGQYCFHLMSALASMPEVNARYFYAGQWSDVIRTNRSAPGVARTNRVKQLALKLAPDLAYGVRQHLRSRQFNAGLTSLSGAVYHEPNFLPLSVALPTVVTVHDLSILRYPETHPRDRVAFMSKRIVKAIRTADRVITDADYVRQEILAEFGVDPSRVVAVPLAAAENFRQQSAEALLETLGALGLRNKGYILAVGTLEPRKNLVTALRAYARLPDILRRDYPFVIAGMSGWRLDQLGGELETLVARGEVKRLGFVPDAQLPALYAGAVAFVYPSLYEGFGLPPLEAMACGTPVMVSDRSTLPEVVGDAGMLLDALDVDAWAAGMQQLIEDTALQASYRELGLRRAAEFSWQKCAEQTLAIYRQVAR